MRFLRRIYEPLLVLALRNRLKTVLIAAVFFIGAMLLTTQIGSEFMPPLNEGDLMFMPVTDPGISLDEATPNSQQARRDQLRVFRRLMWAVGKAGRAGHRPTRLRST